MFYTDEITKLAQQPVPQKTGERGSSAFRPDRLTKPAGNPERFISYDFSFIPFFLPTLFPTIHKNLIESVIDQ